MFDLLRAHQDVLAVLNEAFFAELHAEPVTQGATGNTAGGGDKGGKVKVELVLLSKEA